MKIPKWLFALVVVAALLVGMAAGALLMTAKYTRQAGAEPAENLAEPDPLPEPEAESEPEPAPEPEPEPEPDPVPEPAEPEPEPEPEPTAAELRLAGLQTELEPVIGALDSEWAVYVEDLSGDCAAECYQNTDAETPLISASLIKLFVLGTAHQQLEDGLLEETESLTADLNWMITVSDNAATNRTITLLGGGDAAAGMALVNDWAASIGCEHTELNRLMLADNGMQNYTTVRDCARILRLIYEGSCVSEARSTQMLDLLCAQTVTHKIPAGISQATERVGNKTGELPGLAENDVALVFSDAGDYLLCVMSNNPYSNSAAGEVIRQLSALTASTLLGGE